MTNWKIYRLGDICTLNYGKALTATNRVAGDIPVYSSAGITGSHNVALVQSKGIIVGRKGTVGTVYYSDKPFYCIDTAYYILPDDEKYNFKWLYYRLKSLHLDKLNEDSAVPGLNRETAYAQEISLPPLEEQRRIAGILGAIDDKIENNRRINTNLELQAQTLYKQWFVDSSTVKLGDVVRTTSGGTPSRSHMEFYVGKYGWVKSKELNSSFITKTEEAITDDAIAKSAAKLLPAKSILIAMYGATVGQYAILSQPMTCNQAVCALLPNENYPYTYLFMVAKNIKEELVNKAIGSAQQNISQVIIKDIDISSDIEKIKQFHKIVCPHFDVMEKNQKENETLTTLRDTLLPKLMNGGIKVTE